MHAPADTDHPPPVAAGLQDAGASEPQFPNVDPTKYMSAMQRVMGNPEFLEAAETLGRSLLTKARVPATLCFPCGSAPARARRGARSCPCPTTPRLHCPAGRLHRPCLGPLLAWPSPRTPPTVQAVDPEMASLMELFSNPAHQELLKVKLEDLKSDPELRPVLEDIEQNGQQAMLKYMNDTDVMSKLGKKFQEAIADPEIQARGRRGRARAGGDGTHGKGGEKHGGWVWLLMPSHSTTRTT